MSAILDFYFDTFRLQPVPGPGSSSIVQLPTFAQGSTYTFRIRALAQTVNFPVSNPPYTAIPNAGKSLQLAISKTDGSTMLTQQFTWSQNADPADPYFYGDIPFNTAPINSALPNGATTLPAVLEINLVDGTPKRIFKGNINIDGSLIANATVTVPPGLTPASMEAVLALLANPVVQTLTIKSPDQTKSRVLTEGNDGSPGEEQLS